MAGDQLLRRPAPRAARPGAPRWAEEGITWKPNGLGCRIADFRADLARLADDYDRAVTHLPPLSV
ncbi:MAG: hypothetical protein R2731_13125 [Nocardioides sp.]